MGIHLTYKLPTTNKRPRTPRRSVWCYSLGDFDKACAILYDVDWDTVTNKSDIDLCWSNWQRTYLSIISQCVPQKLLPRKKHLPWISLSILKAIRKRNSLLNKYKRSGNQAILSLYKLTRNRVISELRKAKCAFFKHLQTADDKTFWKLYKTLTRRESSIPALQVPNFGLVCNDMEKANILNNQFFSNFNHTTTPNCDTSAVNNLDNLDQSHFPEEFLCTEDKMLSLISSLDTSKSTGADGVSAKMLKSTAPFIAKSLTKLFNKSLRSGKFPSDWKVARVVPIPKGGDPESPANYRPISILSILSKLLEKHLHDLLTHHLNIFSPLSEHQWGFTSGKSTTSALISYAHDCQEALDCGNELCSVFFDLSKAFDTVPHQQLLFKLFELQVDPFLIRWVSNYLIDRTQSVVLGGAQSNSLPVVSGVPQGSVLGPLLFLIYINGVSASVTDSKITLYADDIALYKIIRNPRDYTLLQGDITSVCSWIADNYLVLNILKCCYMVFSRKHHPTLPNAPLYVGDSHALNKRDHFKYLGVNFSTDLTWSYHINTICKKTRSLIGLLYRNFYQFSNPSTLLKLYKSLIRPHMEYACAVWDPHLAKDVKLMEDVQKFALRVCSKSWNSNYESLLSYCRVPTLSNRRKVLKLCLLFNIMTGRVVYPNKPFERAIAHYPIRHANTTQLSVPFARTNNFKNSYFPSTTALWNSLNFDISCISSLTSFKHALFKELESPDSWLLVLLSNSCYCLCLYISYWHIYIYIYIYNCCVVLFVFVQGPRLILAISLLCM